MRDFLADTTALPIFSTITGILNERYVAGMDWSEVLPRAPSGRP